MDPRTTRKLTEKGQGYFEDEVQRYSIKLARLHRLIDENILIIDQTENQDTLKLTQELIKRDFLEYVRIHDVFCEYLNRTNTEDSHMELQSHMLIYTSIQFKVKEALNSGEKLITEKQPPVLKTENIANSKKTPSRKSRSVKSVHKSSRSHSSSTVSDLYVHQKIKAELARKKLEFVDRESDLMRQRAKVEAEALVQKATIESQLLRVKAEEDTELAELSVKILEEEFQESLDNDSEHSDWTTSHTNRYVVNQSLNVEKIGNDNNRLLTPEPEHVAPVRTPYVTTTLPVFPNVSSPPPFLPDNNESITGKLMKAEMSPQVNGHLQEQFSAENTYVQTTSKDTVNSDSVPDKRLNPSAQPFEGSCTSNPNALNSHTSPVLNQAVMDMSNFLTKKSFILERVKPFVGDSEFYLAWKNTFKEVMKEIDASPSVELDLMIHNLKGQPYEQVKSIKNSNTSDSSLAIKRAWERLDSYYGSPDRITKALKNKLNDVIEKFDFNNKLDYFRLSDTLNEISAVKDDPKYCQTLSYFDTADGVNPVIHKFPRNYQNKWRDKAILFKRNNDVVYPPFSMFCTFVQDMAYVINDPGFDFDNVPQRKTSQRFASQSNSASQTKSNRQFHRQTVTSNKTSVTEENERIRCAIHNSHHLTSDCNAFRSKSIGEKKDILRKHGQCFKCCDGKHLSNNCHVYVKCDTCGSRYHCAAMHNNTNRPVQAYGGERSSYDRTSLPHPNTNTDPVSQVNAVCTEVCGNFKGKSCAKIVLISIHHKHSQHPPLSVYAILDEQSNKSLAKPELFEIFDPNTACESYKLSTCSGSSIVSGRRSHGFVISSLDGQTTFDLPTLIECDAIPNNRHEIPTREVAIYHPHLSKIADLIPPIDDSANILLLIGRDLLRAHHVLDQIRGTSSQPYAQQLPLGWVIIGEACLDGMHTPSSIDVMKTMICSQSEETPVGFFIPCDQKIHISECVENNSIFKRTSEDNRPSLSVEDRAFLKIMDNGMKKDSSGHWTAPLPFKEPRPALPTNRQQAMDRALSLDRSLQRNPTKMMHFHEFMKNLFEAGHVEQAPPLTPETECWYLPLFGVYHPQKKDKIRGVFDSSAKCDGLSLNDVLLSGPDLMNNLYGVLLRFRRESIAIMADIEQMFYCFMVDADHRRYLRFIWHKDNDFEKPLVDYQMKVHVFGNSPSPAVATYGLRKTADIAEEKYGKDMKKFVHFNFYVDDALSSHATTEEAVSLLQRTKRALEEHGHLRLHKITSNSKEVLAAFDHQDLAKDLKNSEFLADDLPTQRSLGVCWNLQEDFFTFKVNIGEKPFTRRGVLSSINSLFDPLGFVAPVTIAGKAILREAMTSGLDWDEPLPPDFIQRWNAWRSSLSGLEMLCVPRTYGGVPISQAHSTELLVFSDASTMAIAAVAYVKLGYGTEQRLGFIMGKTKLAPKHGHTIPRLELCAAVLAVELYDLITREIDIKFDNVSFFTDSRVVIGYIKNESKRFFTYVANRVDKIRRLSEPEDWHYISTKLNPADEGTRSVQVKDLQNSLWLNGPPVTHELWNNDQEPQLCGEEFDDDSEVKSCKMEVQPCCNLGSHRFEKFSTWSKLTQAILLIQKVVRWNLLHKRRNGEDKNPLTLRAAELLIIHVIQHEAFLDEIIALKSGQTVLKTSPIYDLDPYLDDTGLLRIGGRLRRSNLTTQEKNPIIIPKKSHVATLLIDHFHKEVKHQGRLFTEGAIRSAGYWIIGCRRQVNSYLRRCVICKKLRGKQQQPKMADLAEVRLQPAPPFSFVGVDVFGPWGVVTRNTRGVKAQAKRWAVIFTCLVIRAVHIEVLEEMSSSSFVNALRRFVALRGEVRVICSDCGTNFVGAVKELNASVIDVNDNILSNFMKKKGIQWKFNPPHASHMGGSWERLIGVARKILNSLLLDAKVTRLTHEVLVTLMAEVTSIINARPLAGIFYDPQEPYPLSPATLLTLKTTHTVDSFNLEEFSQKDLHKNQWRCVQYLSNCFWKRWKMEYLSSLQQRKKWQKDERNLTEGDLVLLRDNTLHRNDWPMGIIEKTHHSDDSRVRTIEVRVGPERKIYRRPATEVVLLVPKEQ